MGLEIKIAKRLTKRKFRTSIPYKLRQHFSASGSKPCRGPDPILSMSTNDPTEESFGLEVL